MHGKLELFEWQGRRSGGAAKGRQGREKKKEGPNASTSASSRSEQTPFELDLMDICRLDTPLVKRIPNSQRSAFATSWGQLLKQALDDKKRSSWAEFNAFPKLILSTRERRSQFVKEDQVCRRRSEPSRSVEKRGKG
jgi:hypothetical protein